MLQQKWTIGGPNNSKQNLFKRRNMYTNKCYRISEQQGGIIIQNETLKEGKYIQIDVTAIVNNRVT